MANAPEAANENIVGVVMNLTGIQPGQTPSIEAINRAFILASFGYTILKLNDSCQADVIKSIIETIWDIFKARSCNRDVVSTQIEPSSISVQAYPDLLEFIQRYKINPLSGAANLIGSLLNGANNGNPPRNLDFITDVRPHVSAALSRIPALVVNALGYIPVDGNQGSGISDTENLHKAADTLFHGSTELTNKCKSYLLRANFWNNPSEDYKVDNEKANKFFEGFAADIKAKGQGALDALTAYLESDNSRLDAPKDPASFGQVAESVPGQLAEQSVDGEPSARANPTAENTLPPLPRESAELLNGMAYDDEQLQQAADAIMGNSYYNVPLITTYHPGITEKAVAQLLDTCTDRGEHRPFRVTAGDPRERKTVMIPPAFKEDKVPAIWSRAVIGSLGFPFVNFTCPPIMEIIRGTDPKSIKSAYKSVKPLFKECGLKKPIETLKEFAHAKYRNCTLNAVTVDAEELFRAEPGSTVSAGIIDPYSKVLKVKGSASIPLDFLTAFYGVLSPVNAVSQYCELTGMDTRAYLDTLATTGKPPIYILNPKKCSFMRGPKGSLFHELFSSKTAPVLVRARVSTHDGGFIMPEKLADMLFAV